MKFKITIITLIIFNAFSIKAQDWLPIGTQWNFISSVKGQSIPDDVYTITGFEMVGGKECYVLEKSYQSCDLRPKKEYLYKENGKLYYYDFDIGDFLLHHDFSAEIGDVIKIPAYPAMLEFSNKDTFIYKVDSISEIALQQLSLKVFHISHGYYNVDGELTFFTYDYNKRNIIIEDIGYIEGFYNFIESGFCDAAYSFPLRSFYIPGNDDVILIDELLNDNPTIEENILIYPNPVKDYVRIRNIPDDIYQVSVLNNLGQICTSKSLRHNEKTLTLEVSHLDHGFYIIVLSDKQRKNIRIKKIVKIE